jgi:hypothetical protein
MFGIIFRHKQHLQKCKALRKKHTENNDDNDNWTITEAIMFYFTFLEFSIIDTLFLWRSTPAVHPDRWAFRVDNSQSLWCSSLTDTSNWGSEDSGEWSDGKIRPAIWRAQLKSLFISTLNWTYIHVQQAAEAVDMPACALPFTTLTPVRFITSSRWSPDTVASTHPICITSNDSIFRDNTFKQNRQGLNPPLEYTQRSHLAIPHSFDGKRHNHAIIRAWGPWWLRLCSDEVWITQKWLTMAYHNLVWFWCLK